MPEAITACLCCEIAQGRRNCATLEGVPLCAQDCESCATVKKYRCAACHPEKGERPASKHDHRFMPRDVGGFPAAEVLERARVIVSNARTLQPRALAPGERLEGIPGPTRVHGTVSEEDRAIIEQAAGTIQEEPRPRRRRA